MSTVRGYPYFPLGKEISLPSQEKERKDPEEDVGWTDPVSLLPLVAPTALDSVLILSVSSQNLDFPLTILKLSDIFSKYLQNLWLQQFDAFFSNQWQTLCFLHLNFFKVGKKTPKTHPVSNRANSSYLADPGMPI